MKKTTLKWLGVLTVSSLLVGCQSAETKNEETIEQKTKQVVDNQSSTSEHTHLDNQEHNHSYAQDEEAEKIYAGYFEDDQVQERSLSDWEGDWQSVYPYLLDGTLDEVFEHKAEQKGDKTFEEYKAYYETGYKTNTERIVIKGNNVTFYENGKAYTGEYLPDGYEILNYEAGNRGVRYVFKLIEPTDKLPQYIQFSDHNISPTKADHFHLYWGDDREALLKELTNWPTYFPADMDGHTIAHEMIAH